MKFSACSLSVKPNILARGHLFQFKENFKKHVLIIIKVNSYRLLNIETNDTRPLKLFNKPLTL